MNYRKNVILFLCDSSRGIEDLFFSVNKALLQLEKFILISNLEINFL